MPRFRRRDCASARLKAVEIAETHGDPCLRNRATGVLVHAHVARGDLFWAGKVLYDHRDAPVVHPPVPGRLGER